MQADIQPLKVETLEARLNLSVGAAVPAPLIVDNDVVVQKIKAPPVVSLSGDWSNGMIETRVDSTDSDGVSSPRLRRTVLPNVYRGPETTAIPVSTPESPVQANPTATQVNASEVAPYIAQLKGDGIQDNSAALQRIIEVANYHDIKNIFLPAGTFSVKTEVWFHGTGVTLSGMGDKTIIQLDHHYMGYGPGGWAIRVAPKFADQKHTLVAPVTGDTLVVKGVVDFKVGESLYLTNGKGSIREAERRAGGQLTGEKIFFELGSCDYVKVASVSVNADGNTVIRLAGELKNLEEYFNLAPADVKAKDAENYLHVMRITHAADQLTVKNLAIKLNDKQCDASIYSEFARDLVLDNITVINPWAEGEQGGILIKNLIGGRISNIKNPLAAIMLNASRHVTVSGNMVRQLTAEEGVTDSIFEKNTLLNRGTFAIRTNDMLCARLSILNNVMFAGAKDTGSIGIWEGTDITIDGNTITGEGYGSIWLGRTRGAKVRNNLAQSFSSIEALTPFESTGNSWQK